MRPLRFIATVWLGACLATAAPAGDRLTFVDAPALRAELDALAGQTVLVNFWATWCRPCLEEIPALRALERRYAERGFRLVAVSLDDVQSAETHVRPFMDKWFAGFTSYLSSEPDRDTIVSVIDPAWNEILPTSYLVGTDGRIRERIQGELSEAEFAAKIEALLDST